MDYDRLLFKIIETDNDNPIRSIIIHETPVQVEV